MLKQKSRFYARKLASSLLGLAAAVSGTTFGAALAADNITDKASMGQMFLLPADRESTPENIALVSKYLADGQRASDKGEFDKAINSFQQAYGLAREIKHGEGEGQALTAMCLFYQSKGQLARAKELGEHAIEVLADTSNKKALGEGRVALARVYLMQDNTYMAVQQLQAALDSFNDMGSTDGESASNVLLLAADVGIKTGHVKEALQFYEAAASYSGQAGKTKTQITVQLGVAKDLMGLGYFTAALEEANKALTIARETKKADELVAALSIVANAQYCLCEYSNARQSFEEALQIKVPQQSIDSRARLVQGYGFCLSATGDLDQAKVQLEKALPYIKKAGQSQSRAEMENALGVINSLQGNQPAALQMLKAAQETAVLVTPKADRLQCIIMQNLGAAQARLGQNRYAKVQYINALQFAHGKKFYDPILVGRTYAALAESCLNLKEYPDAEEAARKGIAVSQPISDDAALWRLYTTLAQVQLATQQNATESLTSAVSFFRSPQAGDFANPAELTYPSGRAEKGHELVSLLLSSGMTEQALLSAEQLKQEAFINEWHRRGGQVRLADRDIYDDMVTRRAHYHGAEGAGNSPAALMKDWRDWVLRFQHVAAENPGLARLIAPVPISMSDVVKTMAANHACTVDYLVGAQSTIAFVIDANHRLTGLVLPVGKDDLQSQVASLLTSSAKTDDSARATEHRILQLLYSELLPTEVSRMLPTSADQPIVIIPDAVLYNLPFAALITGDGKYLIETHTLTMAPELDVLMNVPRRTKDLSLLVAPDKSGDNSESGQIASVFDPAQVTTLADKDVQALQEQAKSASIIHMATAMKIPQNNPLASVVPFSSQEAGDKVTANSLFELTLPSDLAVMSATSVNAKDFRGNGVQVFTRGLNYAGVRNVLMSLWVAPDPTRTSELVEFYRSRQQGFSQAQSLRKAQLLSLSKDPSPRTWAAFQLLGPSF